MQLHKNWQTNDTFKIGGLFVVCVCRPAVAITRPLTVHNLLTKINMVPLIYVNI